MIFNPAQARANIEIKFVEKDFSKFAIYPVVASYLLNYLHLDSHFKSVLKKKSENFSFSGTEYLLTLFTIIFLGIKRIYKVDDLLADETSLAKVLGFKKAVFPKSSVLYRFLGRINHWSVKRLDKVNFEILLKHNEIIGKTRWLNIDIDQTKKITESKTIQKSAPCYNPTKKGRMGLRITASTVNNLVFSQKLEPGNIGNNDAFEELFSDTLTKLDLMFKPKSSLKKVCSKRIILRVDGGYFSQGFIRTVEKQKQKRNLSFVIRAKNNLKLIKEAREKENNNFVKVFDNRDMEVLTLKNQQILEGLDYRYKVLIIKDKQKQIKSKKKKVYHSTREYEYVLVTDLNSWSAKRIIKYYKKRQGIENVFREQNQSFKADKLPTHSFWGNAFYFWMVSLVGNISFFFKTGFVTKEVQKFNYGNC